MTLQFIPLIVAAIILYFIGTKAVDKHIHDSKKEHEEWEQ